MSTLRCFKRSGYQYPVTSSQLRLLVGKQLEDRSWGREDWSCWILRWMIILLHAAKAIYASRQAHVPTPTTVTGGDLGFNTSA